MKLLFDQNISFRLMEKIAAHYPQAKQVMELGLENFSDIQIWEFARKHDFTIGSFAADFYEIATIKGHPPKSLKWFLLKN